ncbi:MAG: hypothetical protein QCH35_05780 [Methanomicrobiaceae archaeon]|nr:hypothetical protein [Methanomicrobiaceae archaeon]
MKEEEVKEMNKKNYWLAVGALLILAVVAVAPGWAAEVDPEWVAGNPDCADVCEGYWCKEVKFEEDDLYDGSILEKITIYNFTYKIDDETGEPDLDEIIQFDWKSEDIYVTCVIVKGGSGANLYSYYLEYPEGLLEDTVLLPPDIYAVSHITFCGYKGDVPVPEFPTLALPAGLLVGMLGLVFAVRKKNE